MDTTDHEHYVTSNDTPYVVRLIKLLKDSIIAGGGEVFYIVVIYVTNLILSRSMGPGGVGVYAQATGIVLFVIMIARIGLEGSVLRYVSIYFGRQDFRHIRGLILFSVAAILVTSTVLGGGTFFLADEISIKLFHEPQLGCVLRFFALTIPLMAATAILLNAIQGFQRVDTRVYIDRIITPTVRAVLLAMFLYVGLGWQGVILAVLLTALVATALSYRSFYSLWYGFESTTGKAGLWSTKDAAWNVSEWMQFSFPLLLSSISAFAIDRMPTLVLAHFEVSSAVGIFDIVTKLALLVQFPLVVSNTIFAPMIGEMWAKKNLADLEATFKIVTKWVFTSSLFIFFVLALSARPILNVFGPEFDAGMSAFLILSLGQLVNASTGAVGWLLIMTGYANLHLVNSALLAVTTLVFTYYATPHFGILGPALAMGLAVIIVNLLRLAEVFYIHKIHPYRWDFIKPFGSACIAVGMVVLVSPDKLLRSLPEFWGYMAKGILFGLVFILLLIIFRFEGEEKELLRLVAQKFRSSSRA